MRSQRCQQQIKTPLLIYPRIWIIDIPNLLNLPLLIQFLCFLISHMIDEGNVRIFGGNIESLIMLCDERKCERWVSSVYADVLEGAGDIFDHILYQCVGGFVELD